MADTTFSAPTLSAPTLSVPTAPRSERPARPAAPARFWDRVARRYARRPIADMTAYETRLARTRAHMRPDMEVLELGCGTGGTALLHAPHVRHLRAVDFAPGMIEIARGKAGDVANVSFEVDAIETIEAPAGAYDMILALNVLHLVEDRAAALSRIHALLKPGGVFVSSTGCLADMAFWIRAILPAGRALGLFPKVSVFSGKAFEAELVAAGFEIAETWRPAPDAALFAIARKP